LRHVESVLDHRAIAAVADYASLTDGKKKGKGNILDYQE